MTRPKLSLLLHPSVQSGNSYLGDSNQRRSPRISKFPLFASSNRMDILFIDALVAASSCRHHIHSISTQTSIPKTSSTYHKPRRRTIRDYTKQNRMIHITRAKSGPPAITQASISRDEYKQMLDYYIEPLSTQTTWGVPEPSIVSLPSPVFEKTETVHEKTAPTLQENRTIGERLTAERLANLLDRNDSTHQEIMTAYSALPFPGVLYLPDEKRRLLLHRISLVERKNKENMFRYLSIVDDMKAADLPMSESEWNSAISFIGRCFSRVGASEVEAALQTWKEMEQKAQVRSGNVTFNILFDIAAKAGKFVLAEMILKEMEARNLPLNRFARVGIIYYHGLKADGDGIRKSYKAFVDAGEIVDTVVMNCVIASLVRAGEPSAADQVYERMKRMYALKSGIRPPTQNRKYGRELGRILDTASRVFRSDPERLRQLQDEQFLCPNLQTYSIFIEHYVSESGELSRVAALLDEMQDLGVPMDGRIFVKLFKGFTLHGGVRYSSWTKARLESVWQSLLKVLDERVDNVQVGKWMVVWAVRAFEKCCGRERSLQIWEELRTRWKAKDDEEGPVYTLLRDILTERHKR